MKFLQVAPILKFKLYLQWKCLCDTSQHIWPIPNILRPRPGPRLLLAQISVQTKTWNVSVLMARTATVRDRAWSPLQWPVPVPGLQQDL